MIIAYLAGIFLLSILLATVIIPRILFISYKKRLFDVPDSRKVHKTPIPRLGGLSFLPVILIALCSVTGIRYYTNHPVDMLWASDLFIQYLFLIVGLTSFIPDRSCRRPCRSRHVVIKFVHIRFWQLFFSRCPVCGLMIWADCWGCMRYRLISECH